MTQRNFVTDSSDGKGNVVLHEAIAIREENDKSREDNQTAKPVDVREEAARFLENLVREVFEENDEREEDFCGIIDALRGFDGNGNSVSPEDARFILTKALSNPLIPKEWKEWGPPAGLIRQLIGAAKEAQYREQKEIAKWQRIVSDLQTNNCHKAVGALSAISDAITDGNVDDVARLLGGFGCIHTNRSRLQPETIACIDNAAEDATAFLLDRFFAIVWESKDLFYRASCMRPSILRSKINSHAVYLIRQAKKMAFGNRNEDAPSVFGGPGFAALGRLIVKGRLPQLIIDKLRYDVKFATTVGTNGKELLSELVAPPRS